MKQIIKKSLIASVASALLLGGSAVMAAGMDVPMIKATPILEGLDKPWDMNVRPDGTMFFTEICKGLSMRSPDGKVTNIYGMKGSSGYSSSGADLFCSGQAGMMGVVADRNFDDNRRLYVASTSDKYHGSGCKTNFERCDGNIVMRLTLSKDLKSVTDRTDIVKDIQYKPFESNQPFGGPGAHNGGRLRVGPGGYLWVAGGDRHRGVCPQSPDLLCGKVLRIDTDGNAHPDNNPPAGFDKRIYTYGHRNVQGIDFRPRDSSAYTAEHGP